MNFENISLSIEAGIARLTLNRPDKLNSFTEEMHAELRAALDHIQENQAARVLVLTGAGRAFCAGQDLADRAMQIKDGKLPFYKAGKRYKFKISEVDAWLRDGKISD